MNYQRAKDILQIKEPINKKDVKKSYYSLAIKYHPDKSKDNSQKFLEIKEAYEFLNKYLDYEEETEEDAGDYISLIQKCIKLISPTTQWSNLFMDSTFKNIINDCQNISLKIFKDLDKQKAIEIYTFLSTYKKMFHISEDTLQKMNELLKEKRKNDNLIVLTPTLDDLFEEKIYILEICDKKFYIPLWCHELAYDVNGGDLIVKCEPQLPNSVEIDDHNNLFVNIERNIKDALKEDIIFVLGKKSFKIKSKELFVKHKQTHILYNEGIPRFNQKNIYKVQKSNIYVNINLS